MTDADWAARDAAFDRALDFDGEARDAFLASLDEATRAALAPLLRDALADDPLLDHRQGALGDLAATDDGEDRPAVAEGTRVGPYQIVDLVGEGGMGRVYRARRADGAFDRTVALKLVRHSLALAGADVADRLRRERDLLAALDHPGIARLLDGGETDDGVPFLVTEFVDGAPITAYADAHGLDVRQRTRLVAEVARAVDHAHRRFVVHRDLKPSNVLVTEADGEARPVVLDFGIAKLLDEAEADDGGAFPLTRTGLRLLTPAYAAPELYDPTATVTTAADVYGLGALLYEVLTGHRPHDAAEAAGTGRLGRAVGPPTTEPTRPSKVVTGSVTGPAPSFDAAERSRALRGDLDVICLRALHPDPSRRYGSAAALAEDLGRYLAGRPVEARRDSAGYVVGRFVRRNRALVAAAGVALAALVVGLAVALAALGSERSARAEAEASAERAEGAAGFLSDVFRAANPALNDGRDLSARDLLAASLGRVDRVENPATRGYLLTLLGHTYLSLGDEARSESLFVASVRTLSTPETRGRDRAHALYFLGRSRGIQGDYLQADSLFREAQASFSESDDPQTWFDTWRDRSWVLRESGDLSEASLAAAEAVRVARERLTDKELPYALWELGACYREEGRLDEAEAVLREMVERLTATFGPNDLRVAGGAIELSDVLVRSGRLDEAERLMVRTAAVYRRIYGIYHYETLEFLPDLAVLQIRIGKRREGAARLDTAYAVARQVLTADDRRWALVARTLADGRNRLGAYPEAEALARQALATAERYDDLEERGRAQSVLGDALAGRGETAAAEVTYRSALADLQASGVDGAELDGLRSKLGRR